MMARTVPPLRGRLRRDEPAARHFAWRIGGSVARLYEPPDSDDLLTYLAGLARDEPVLWLGMGCNVLIRDGGYPGTVLMPRHAFERVQRLDGTLIEAGCGVRLPKLARFCAQHGLGGAEPFAGWPNTLGGALHLSVMRERHSLWPLVERIEVLERRGRRQWLSLADLRERGINHDEWLIAAQLRLASSGPPAPYCPLKPAATPGGAHGPLFRAAQGRTVHELTRQAGLWRAVYGSAELAEEDGNFLRLGPHARVDDVERLLDRVQDTVFAELGVHLERQVQIVGRRP